MYHFRLRRNPCLEKLNFNTAGCISVLVSLLKLSYICKYFMTKVHMFVDHGYFDKYVDTILPAILHSFFIGYYFQA